jgi:DNA-binding transcriptional ArsR family regulator
MPICYYSRYRKSAKTWVKIDMEMENISSHEVVKLQNEIAKLRSEFDIFRAQSNVNQDFTVLNCFRQSCADIIITGELTLVRNALERAADNCAMKEKCIPVLETAFPRLLDAFRAGSVSVEELDQIKKQHEAALVACKFKKCAPCIMESTRLLGELTNLLKNARIYIENDDIVKIQGISEKDVIERIGDPLSHAVRVKILKSLASEPKSFADLSILTHLRGGNLLFHLEKLNDSRMIFQKGERKEYSITPHGYEILKFAADLLEKISS